MLHAGANRMAQCLLRQNWNSNAVVSAELLNPGTRDLLLDYACVSEDLPGQGARDFERVAGITHSSLQRRSNYDTCAILLPPPTN